jgi:hypothetical protein
MTAHDDSGTAVRNVFRASLQLEPHFVSFLRLFDGRLPPEMRDET